jgi:DNA-binding LacI/PurR family transcriptional regulator
MSSSPGPTLNDVALAAGVSRMTVSRVLRDSGYASEATRSRVLEAVRKLEYRPNPMVSAFMTYVRSGTISQNAGVLAYLTSDHREQPWRTHQPFVRFYNGAAARAAELGFKLEEFPLRQPGISMARLSGILYARGISGLIVAPMSSAHAHLNLDWKKFSAVAIGYSLLKPALPRVCNDQFSSILIAMRELWHLGYRRIGLAMPQADDARVHYHWSAGYLSFYQRRGERRFPQPYLPEKWNFDEVIPWIRKQRVDAIVSTHISMLERLELRGLRIPEEVGLVNLDWLEELTSCSSIDQRPEEIGEAAVDLVVERVNHNRIGIPDRQRTVNLPGVWRPGRTVRRQSNV